MMNQKSQVKLKIQMKRNVLKNRKVSEIKTKNLLVAANFASGISVRDIDAYHFSLITMIIFQDLQDGEFL